MIEKSQSVLNQLFVYKRLVIRCVEKWFTNQIWVIIVLVCFYLKYFILNPLLNIVILGQCL